MLPTFWAIPTSFLSGGGGRRIALINSVANLGGLFGPWFLGRFDFLAMAGTRPWGGPGMCLPYDSTLDKCMRFLSWLRADRPEIDSCRHVLRSNTPCPTAHHRPKPALRGFVGVVPVIAFSLHDAEGTLTNVPVGNHEEASCARFSPALRALYTMLLLARRDWRIGGRGEISREFFRSFHNCLCHGPDARPARGSYGSIPRRGPIARRTRSSSRKQCGSELIARDQPRQRGNDAAAEVGTDADASADRSTQLDR